MVHVLQIIMTFRFIIQKQTQSYRHKTVSHSVYLCYPPLFLHIVHIACLLIISIYLSFLLSHLQTAPFRTPPSFLPYLPILLAFYFLHFERPPLITK